MKVGDQEVNNVLRRKEKIVDKTVEPIPEFKKVFEPNTEMPNGIRKEIDSKPELKSYDRWGQNMFINVWDSCGIFGYMIPWADWKCTGLLPTCHAKRNVDVKFVSLVSKVSLNGGFLKLDRRFPCVLLEDFMNNKERTPIDWDAIRDKIIELALKHNLVMHTETSHLIDQESFNINRHIAEKFREAHVLLKEYIDIHKARMDDFDMTDAGIVKAANEFGNWQRRVNAFVYPLSQKKSPGPEKDTEIEKKPKRKKGKK